MNDLDLLSQSAPSSEECEFDATYGSAILVCDVTTPRIGPADHGSARGLRLDQHFVS